MERSSLLDNSNPTFQQLLRILATHEFYPSGNTERTGVDVNLSPRKQVLQLIAQIYDVADIAWVCIPPDLYPTRAMFQRYLS